MVTMLPPPGPTQTEPHSEPADGTGLALQDQMPEWFRTRGGSAVLVLVLSLLYVLTSYLPLGEGIGWGDLAYGRWIWNHQTLPTTEPLVPLATGMPVIDTEWLGQLAGYGAWRLLGLAGVTLLLAGGVTWAAGLFCLGLYRRTGRAGLTLLGLLLVLMACWPQLTAARPALAGLVCFVTLWFLVAGRRPGRGDWLAVPLLFALWSNLHASFVLGLLVLAARCAGHGLDLWRRTGRLGAMWTSARVRRRLMLLEVAFIATLLNPYALGLYAGVLSLVGQPNLSDLEAWQPLTLRTWPGMCVALMVLAFLAVGRISPRRVRTADALLLVGLGAAALWNGALLLWWMPLASEFLMRHLHVLFPRRSHRRPEPRSLWTVTSLALGVMAFGLSPAGGVILHQQRIPAERRLSDALPVRATAWLQQHPQPGLTFAPPEWSGFLLWNGADAIRPFVGDHAEWMPRRVWGDATRVLQMASGLDIALDRAGVNTLLLSPQRHSLWAGSLRVSKDWRLAYEDRQSIVYVRRTPLPD